MTDLNPRKLLLNAYVYAVLFFILAPIVVILPMAFSETDYLTFPPEGFTFDWFGAFFGNSRWMKATTFSLQIAVLTAITTCVIATMSTYALMRGAGRLGALFQGLLIAPIVVPHIALAVALYLFFRQTGLSSTITGYSMSSALVGWGGGTGTASSWQSIDDTYLGCPVP